LKNKKLIILCRGKSLENIKLLNNEEYDTCIIVNDFKREVLHSYVKDFLAKQKNIEHFICRENFALLTKQMYDYFNVKSVTLNVLKKEYSGEPPYRTPSRLKLMLDNMNVKSKYLDDSILKYSEPRKPTELRLPGFPTMGVLTTSYAAAVLGYTDITVVGLDFYEAEYLTVCSSTKTKEAPKKSGIDKAPRMKNFLANLLEKFPDTLFTFYTYSSFNPGLKNVKINNKILEENK
tara:strand:+ start:8446 stop:9147 length:702 start_codon:yes stop_codon:yes gene_type:complete